MQQSLHGIESGIWILFLISAVWLSQDSRSDFFLVFMTCLNQPTQGFPLKVYLKHKTKFSFNKVLWFIYLLRQSKWEVNNMKNIWKRWKPISSHWRSSKHSEKPVLVILSTPLLTMSILTIDFCKLSKNPGVFSVDTCILLKQFSFLSQYFESEYHIILKQNYHQKHSYTPFEHFWLSVF